MENDSSKAKNLDFWDFESVKDPNKIVQKKSLFPQDREVTKKEMEFVKNKLKQRLLRFQDSSCFNYLDAYYNFYLKTYNSKSNEDLNKNFDLSIKCLKLFTYCFEIEQEEKNKLKI
jgi:hypothetical protein